MFFLHLKLITNIAGSKLLEAQLGLNLGEIL